MTWNPLRLAWGLWVWLLVVPVVLVAALPILALPAPRDAPGRGGRGRPRVFPALRLPRAHSRARTTAAGRLRHRREPRELHRRAAPLRLPAAALRLRDQEGGRAPAARRPPAAPARAPLRRACQSPRGRQRRAANPAIARGRRGGRLLSGRHVPPAARASRDSTAAHLRSPRARACRSRPSRSAARASALGGGSAWPRWGRIEVEVLEPLPAQTGSGDAATRLRDAARARIGAAVDEPML